MHLGLLLLVGSLRLLLRGSLLLLLLSGVFSGDYDWLLIARHGDVIGDTELLRKFVIF